MTICDYCKIDDCVNCSEGISWCCHEQANYDKIVVALKSLSRHAKAVDSDLTQYGGSIVPHLVDTDDNNGQYMRDAIEEAEQALKECGEA